MVDRLRAALSAVARRWKLVSAGVVVGVALVVVGLWPVNWFQPRTTQAAVRQAIETHLPLGSTVEQSLAFLDAQGWIDCRTAVLRPNRDRDATGQVAFEQQDPAGSTLLAAIPDAYPGFLVRGGST
jgi:hypothetical protein